MANQIRFKRASGSDPSASDLAIGEPGLRTDTAELFFKKDDGSVAKVSGGGGGPNFKYLELRNAANNGAASYPGNDFTLVTAGTTTAITPVAANTLLVSVSGVIQKPNSGTSTSGITGFIVDGSRLKTATNLPAAPDFILYQESGGIGEPSDNTVSTDKIIDDAVTYAKIQNVSATNRILGRDSSGAGVIEEITPANLRTMINVEDGATGDQSNSEIKTAYEANSNTNAFTDALLSKLNGIEASATADQSASEIVALIADQTIAPSTIDMEDDERIKLGASDDLQIYHSGSDSWVRDLGTGNLYLDTQGAKISLISDGNQSTGSMAHFNKDGSVQLFHNNVERFTSTSTGATITGNLAVTGTVDGRDLATDGTKLDGIEASATADQTDAEIRTAVENATDSNVFTDADHTKLNAIEASATADQTASEIVALVADQTIAPSEIDMEDNEKIKFGTGDDLEIYHDGTNSYIKNTGALKVPTGSFKVKNAADDENMIIAYQNNQVELYFDNDLHFATTANGVKTNGDLSFRGDGDAQQILFNAGDGSLQFNDNTKLKLGAGDDLEIYHSGSHSVIRTTTGSTGNLNIRSDNDILIGTLTDGNNFITCTEGAQVELHHNYSKKFETKSDGVEVTGNIYATGNIGRDSNDYILFTDNNQMDVYINGNNEFRFEADGDFHADGDITAFSTTTASDARLKSDIHTINDALGIVGKLRGVSYKWLRDGKSDIGVIAQEVEEVIPEIVKTKKMPGLDGLEEVKTVDYGKMVGVLINAVNELKKEIEELKNAKTTG